MRRNIITNSFFILPLRPIISLRYDVAPAHRPVASSYENRVDVAPITDFGVGATSERVS